MYIYDMICIYIQDIAPVRNKTLLLFKTRRCSCSKTISCSGSHVNKQDVACFQTPYIVLVQQQDVAPVYEQDVVLVHLFKSKTLIWIKNDTCFLFKHKDNYSCPTNIHCSCLKPNIVLVQNETSLMSNNNTLFLFRGKTFVQTWPNGG